MVGAYAQWLDINSGRKEALKAKTLAGKFKDSLDELSVTSSSTTNNISELNDIQVTPG